MKKMIFKKIIIFAAFIFIFVSVSSFSCSALSYQEGIDLYNSTYNEEMKKLSEQNKDNNSQLTRSKSYNINVIESLPRNLTFEQFKLISEVNKISKKNSLSVELLSDRQDAASLDYLQELKNLRFMSYARGSSVDEHLVWYDVYTNKYYVLEYNSTIMDIAYTPINDPSDGYTGYFWLRIWDDVALSSVSIYSTAIASYLGVQSSLGTSYTGDLLWASYLYSFDYPIDYNASNEITIGQSYGSSYTGSVTSGYSDKRGQYFAMTRFRLMNGYQIDPTFSNFSPNVVPIAMGRILYCSHDIDVVQSNGAATVQYIEGNTGNIIGSATVNGINLLNMYESFQVPYEQYWLYSNFLQAYESYVSDSYGWLSEFVYMLETRFNYFFNYVIPIGLDDFTDWVYVNISAINSYFQMFIAANVTSPFLPFFLLLPFFFLALIIRFNFFLARL